MTKRTDPDKPRSVSARALVIAAVVCAAAAGGAIVAADPLWHDSGPRHPRASPAPAPWGFFSVSLA
jgi:hypothetical protein